MIEEDLRTKLLADNATLLDTANLAVPGLAVSYNKTPEKAPATRIFFVRSETSYEPLLNGTPVIEHVMFDVECVSDDMATSMELADAIRAMNGVLNTTAAPFTGTMGSTEVLACEVSDQSDQYVYHHDYADEGLAVDALRLELMV